MKATFPTFAASTLLPVSAAAVLLIGLNAAASAATIADFVDDFPTVNGSGPQFDGTETPGPGWDYMWNPGGVADLGNSANYQSLVPNTVQTNTVDDEGLFTNIGNIAFNAAGQGNFQFGRIGIGTNHPGPTVANNDYRAIYAYTIQAGEEGIISITNSSLQKTSSTGTDIDLDVYVNDSLIGALSLANVGDKDNSTVFTFNGVLGTLNIGDTVYVTVGNSGNAAGDQFLIDFTLESDIPEPATLAMIGAGGLVMLRRRR